MSRGSVLPDASTVIASIFGGIGTGLVGLVAVHIQQRFTANTEMLSATIGELEKMADECATAAVKAWSSPGDPLGDDTVETVCQLHAMGEFIVFIQDRVRASRLRLNSPFLNFRAATSGDNFDVKGRKPSPQRAIDIKTTAAALRISLRSVDYDRRSLHLPFS